MTKTNSSKRSKTVATNLIVLGFDKDLKPRGARFPATNSNEIIKTAEQMGLHVYAETSRALADTAKKLPVGKIDTEGGDAIPVVSQHLYSEVVVALVADPRQRIEEKDKKDADPPPATYPPGFGEIAPGHFVIAQEGREYGWWEAIVIDRADDMLVLRYRDFPRLPKFARHRSAVALVSPRKD
jgi:hypothetical protein